MNINAFKLISINFYCFELAIYEVFFLKMKTSFQIERFLTAHTLPLVSSLTLSSKFKNESILPACLTICLQEVIAYRLSSRFCKIS